MTFFTEAMRMFSPFAAQQREDGKIEGGTPSGDTANDLDTLKRQMADMQAKLEALSRSK
jgi:polyhydroxyalkanoate synthesis regulator protein